MKSNSLFSLSLSFFLPFSSLHHSSLSFPFAVALPRALVLQGGGAPVNTIGFVAPLLRNATSGEVLESDSRTASAIVHQYDRHPALHSHVNRLAGVPHTMAMEELLDHDILRRFCAQEGAQSHAKACRPWRCPWRSSSSRGSWWPW